MESRPKRKDLCGRALSLQLCCATAVPCCALCACWALGVHCCVIAVCWCTSGVFLCSGVLCSVCCASLLCIVLHGLAVLCVLCSNEQLRCVGCWFAMLSGKLCCALVCLAVLCPVVRWSSRVIPNREDLCGWPRVCHHAVCTKYPKVIQCGCHVESILRPWTDLG